MRTATASLLLLVTSLAMGSPTAPGEEERELAYDGLKAYVVADFLRSYRHEKTRTVAVDVEVRPDGTIGQACTVGSGTKGVETLVRNWTFVPFAGTQPRWRTITLVLEGDTGTDGELSFESHYESPLTLRVRRHVPRILHVLQRVNGVIPEKTCSLHHVPMTVEEVPILWGLVDPLGDAETYFTAQEKEFPNARDVLFGGCEEGTETMGEVYICAKCRQARFDWLAAHPDLQPAN